VFACSSESIVCTVVVTSSSQKEVTAWRDVFERHAEPVFVTCVLLTEAEANNNSDDNNNEEGGKLHPRGFSWWKRNRCYEEFESDEEKFISGVESLHIKALVPRTLIAEPQRRSERVSVKRTTLEPTFQGQTSDHPGSLNTHLVQGMRAPCSLKQGIMTKKFGRGGKQAAPTEMK